MAIEAVLDASVCAAIAFGEPGAERFREALAEVELIAPDLLDYEMANVLLTKLRRAPHERERLLIGYALYRTMRIARRRIDHDAMLALAEFHGLTAYDGSYLWLAVDGGRPLLTADRKLTTAWQTAQPKRC